MSYPILVRQPKWVLDTASADRSDQLLSEPDRDALEAWEWIKPGFTAYINNNNTYAERLWGSALDSHPSNIFLLRTINQYAPHLLKKNPTKIQGTYPRNRVAVLLAGELRCFKQTKHFLEKLSKYADIFICTSQSFKEEACSIRAKTLILNKAPTFPVGAMHQWHKLSKTLEMVKNFEHESGQRYSHILKLRTDFYHANPDRLLKELVEADGLICASDKAFGGSRELMLLFEGFYAAITSKFDMQEKYYWPINVEPILRSDDSTKWYGMAFPKELVGEPTSVQCLRQTLKKGGSQLANALLKWKPNSDISSSHYVKFFKGHPRFASEICFARFLNFNAISTKVTPGLTGFLRSDRLNS